MKVSMSAKAFRLLLAGAFAASVTVLPISGGFAAGETLGAKCTNEGESTGTFSTSLVCAKNSAGRLVWTKVKLSASNLKPVNALRAPRGSIEFWHWRAEDKAWFDKIIADFETLNPGVKISQVISNSVDYQATGIQKARTNKKAALFTTFRGAQFNTAATTDFYTDLTNEQFTKRNVIKSMMGAGQYQGKQLGIPYQSLFNNPIYNIEIFKKEGWKLPKKFSEWISYCKTAKAAGYTPMAWMGGFRAQAGQIINSALMNTAGGIVTLEPKMSGNMGITGMNWTEDVNARYTGITNNTFILGVNKNAGKTEQQIARAFMSYLLTGPVATYYANSSKQHVTVLDVSYTDVNLRNTSSIMSERLVLAPRFQFLNIGVRDALEDALIAIVGGTSVDKALTDGAAVIKTKV
nr:extracellular solute-binding protein [Actinomycetota bacterium]